MTLAARLVAACLVADGAMGRSPCTDPQGTPAAFTDQSYEYCPANQTIYIGQNALWALYDQIGDAAPVVGLAHEWGHHVRSGQASRKRRRCSATSSGCSSGRKWPQSAIS